MEISKEAKDSPRSPMRHIKLPERESPQDQKKPPSKYNINSMDFIVIFSFTIVVHLYQLGHLSVMTHRIQNETPLKGVVQSWFGLWRDNSDGQWRDFRENLLLFIPGMLLFGILGRLIRYYFRNQPQEKFQALIYYYLITGCGFLIFLFEGGFIMWILFTSSNYFMQKFLYRYRFYPIILWTYSILSLYYIYFYNNQPWDLLNQIFPSLGPDLQQSSRHSVVAWWTVTNMTMLRVMSFCLDRHWAFRKHNLFDQYQHQLKCETCAEDKSCLKSRIEINQEPQEYNSIINYYAYLMYLPLFITGPQLTFNAFISQVKISQNVYTNKFIIIYFIRALGKLLEVEIYTHLQFCCALSKIEENKQYWIDFALINCLFMALMNIFFIWFKFLAIWRLARSLSLLNEMDCPENMLQCLFISNYFEEFWRSWHRGFNQWLIRYLFIPLGGSKTKVWNIWIIFTFVAIWHDFQLNLVIWAWSICAALIPEMLVKRWVNANSQAHLWKTWWFKYLNVACGSAYVWIMLLSNLIGFGSGRYNAQIILFKFQDPGAFVQMFTAWFSTLSYTVLINYVRDIQAEKLYLKRQYSD